MTALTIAAAGAACGDDNPAHPPSGPSLEAGADAPIDATPPPTPAPFGLDARMPNLTCTAPKRPTFDTGVKFVDAFPGLTFSGPMKLVQAPGDPSRFYVAQRGFSAGPTKVITFPANATMQSQVTDFATVTVDPTGEGGLLGIAFHPQWATNHTVFLSYTRTFDGGKDPDPAPDPNSGLTSVVSKWTSNDGGQTIGNPVEILTRVQPYTNHNGGNIAFGPDGYLYFGLGDGGSGNDPLNSGQTLSSFLGKMLRIDVDNGSPYGIPPTNPFANSAGNEKKEIFAYGLRNPFRWSFDRGTGDLWVGDVGQNTWEEIDKVSLGGNYGWNVCEGFHKRGSTTELCATPGMKEPIVEHPRSEANSITGGVVYRGKAMPDLVGTYIYGDYAQSNIWALVFDAAGKPAPKLLGKVGSVVDFGQDADGEIYLVGLDGKISKMVPNTTPTPSTFPDKLSKTGCVVADDPKKPVVAMIPYGVRAALWSDGAEKDRYFAIPDGTKISVGTDGDYVFPKGTVLMKTFRVGGKRVETRLFMLHDDGEWGGYSYEWDDAQTDATLLAGAKVRALGGTDSWAYPSRSQCLQCHTAAAGGSLGLEIAQQNGDFVYASTNRISNQLATLDHLGFFAAPLGDVSKLAKLSEPFGADPIDARARAYLHANCSQCHRPTGGGGGNIDLRYTQPLAKTLTCNQAPQEGLFGLPDAKVVFPGDPSKSILSLRVHATDAKRMPPLAVRTPDPQGTKLLDDWITATKTCP
jgi:uncharacterized repeat protein (TIGR03806 family)